MNERKTTNSRSGRETFPNLIKHYNPNVKSFRPNFTQNCNPIMQGQRTNFAPDYNPNFTQNNTYIMQQHHSSSYGSPRFTQSRPQRGNYTPRHFSNRGRGFSIGYRQSYNNNYGVNKNYNENQNYGYQFYCDTCDRGFPDDRLLKVHVSEHVPCGLDGCTYVANQAAVTKHIKHQHTSGLFEKIRTKNTPEAIAKWISERRLKFPTGEKIEKQRALNLECLERGEKLETHTRGRGRGRGFHNRTVRGNFKNPGRGRRNVRGRRRIFKIPLEIINRNKEDWNGELQPFAGTKSIYGEEEFSSSSSEEEYSEDDMKDYFEDEEWLGQFAIPIKPEEVKITNSLGALMSMYGSSDESDNEEEPVTQEGTNLNNKNQTNVKERNTVVELVETNLKLNDITTLSEDKKLMNTNIIQQNAIVGSIETNIIVKDNPNDKVPEESTIVKSKESLIESLEETTSKSRKRKRMSSVKIEDSNESKSKVEEEPIYRKRRIYSVYEKLLGKFLNNEIRHERNMLFQCVHYVVDNKFFGINENKHVEATTVTNDSTEEIFYNNIKESKVKVLL